MLSAVILSTGRSGSRFIARLLSEAGVPCGHEAVYGPPRVTAPIAPVESSWLALPHVESGDFAGPVFHQVRHPLAVLSSMCNGSLTRKRKQKYRRFRESHSPAVAPPWDAPDDVWASWFAGHIVDWNERCERQAARTWKVEDVDLTVLEDVAEAAGISLDVSRANSALRSVSTSTNKHQPGPSFTWDDVERMEAGPDLIRQASRYGYL